MTLRRTIASASASLLLLAGLTACFALPGSGGPPANELTGTTWSGVDSDGDSWAFEFQSDGTVGLTYNGNSYDDSRDTWSLSGSTLTIDTTFDDGDVAMTGSYSDGASSIDLDGSYTGGSFTLTITED